MSEVVAEETGGRHPVVVLSGPSFAAEVARAAADGARRRVDRCRGACVRCRTNSAGRRSGLYGSDDVVGVEIGAALKNIIAIAAGVVESMELGHNALSALITRGLAEISRLACAMGGRRETLAGLSGLGDLVLTCTGALSRNRHVGIELGPRPVARRDPGRHADGRRRRAHDARRRSRWAQRYGVELPIAAQMAEVLAGRETPREAVGDLMLRPQRGEHDGAQH